MWVKNQPPVALTATGGMEAGIAGETTRLTGYLNGDTHTHVTTTHEHHLLYACTACIFKKDPKQDITQVYLICQVEIFAF